MTPSLNDIQALLGFLRSAGDAPDTSAELLREHWLGPLFYLRLGEQQHPLRDS